MKPEVNINTLTQEPMEKHMSAVGLTDEAVFSILWLATEYGCVTLPNFEEMEDDWGGHRSLTLQITKDGPCQGYYLRVKNHPHY
jgi:hypothetical protein